MKIAFRHLALPAFLGLLGPFGPGAAKGQSLSGRYFHQGATGPVSLVLQDHGGARLTGTVQGADGTTLRLDGAIEAGRATGAVDVGGERAWFALGVVDGELLLVIAELDATTGQPNLDAGWTMNFTPVGGGEAGGAAGGVAGALGSLGMGGAGSGQGGGVAPGAGVGGGEASRGVAAGQGGTSPQVQQWIQHLRGKRVTYMDSYSSSDIGGYGGYSTRWDAYLCSDGTFYFQQNSSVNADVGGAWGLNQGENAARGSWRIVEQMGKVVIQYQMSDGTANYGVLTFRDGSTYFDGERVYVTGENPYCR